MSERRAEAPRKRVAVIGGGWAALAAAIHAIDAGHDVSLWEASRTWGGRARALTLALPDGTPVTLDNGQHILIGAYRECLRLMRRIGLQPEALLMRLPLELQFPDGNGIRCPDWHAPLDVLAGVLAARGWRLAERLATVRTAVGWRLRGFDCPEQWTVTELCHTLPARALSELIEPLCVSALNSSPDASSARVFLRVLRDAVFGARGGSNLLLPRTDLSSLFPSAAAGWLAQRGARLHPGRRIRQLVHDGQHWQVDGAPFDQVILATAAPDALHVLQQSLAALPPALAGALRGWMELTRRLQHAAISTVYAWAADARLTRPLLALRSGAAHGAVLPAQFVFDRGQLDGPRGLLAFVVSISTGTRDELQSRVLAQARAQLGLELLPVATVTDRRATIVCHPGLVRPPMYIAPGLLACADYVDGPYPSTLEGALRCAAAVLDDAPNAGLANPSG